MKFEVKFERSERKELSFGEKAVGINFNPSQNEEVAKIKSVFAKAIDDIHALRLSSESSEQKRLASIAITEIQGAQMWAIKAATWQD